MSSSLDVETIYRQERQRWMREEAPRRTMRDVIADSVPYWIILVALVLYGLSAPHTAGVFDKLTPGWGWIAPIGVEFGLLYVAFRRRLAKARSYALGWTLRALEVLLFLTAMLVNGAGSFTSVVSVTQLESLSMSAIVGQFEFLPATSQAALVMALLSAFIIPIGALVAGDGLAALALERAIRSDHREQRWREVEHTVFYRAVFVRYLQQGMTERDARLRASSEVRGYLGQSSSSSVRMLSAPGEQAGQVSAEANGQAANVRATVKAYLDGHPELEPLSVNQVHAVLRNAGVRAGRTTVAEVLQQRRNI